MKWFFLATAIITVNALGLLYLYCYFRRLENRRLAELIRVVRQIEDGNMLETATENKDRFKDLACAINDMSANIQEVLILLWKQSSQSLSLIKRLAGCLRWRDKTDPDDLALILQQCKDIEQSYDDCQELLFGFEFFGVNLDSECAWHHKPDKETDQPPVHKT